MVPCVHMKELAVSDPVWIPVDGRRVAGHIAGKSRTHCIVVVDGGASYKASWSLVSARSGAARKQVTTQVDAARARLQAGDRVEFTANGGTTLQGTIVRLNPRRAVVACGNGDQWQVPYEGLVRTAPDPQRESAQSLDAVAARARELMARHGLEGWSFQFDDAMTRAGVCRYDTKVISMAREYCLRTPEPEWTDTLLHEIAHALAGRQHHHDAVWQQVARQIGCGAERCHDVEFAQPRYIVSCPRCRWAHTRNRRQRGLACRHCDSPVVYRPYSDDLWDQARKNAGLPSRQ